MKIKKIMTVVLAAILLSVPAMDIYASDEGEYVTITVHASDDNEGLTYALDSDSADNFGPSNKFVVDAGTSHTIYVKDAAGNVTTQIYEPPEEAETDSPASTEENSPSAQSGTEPPVTAGKNDREEIDNIPADKDYVQGSAYLEDSADGQTINIDLQLGKTEESEEKPYEIKNDTPAEQGEGTVYTKAFLDGTDSSEQVFYSVTTTEGDVFYLLVDQGQENNNVYLLNQVSNKDLKALAEDDEDTQTHQNEEDSLLKALSGTSGDDTGGGGTDSTTEKKVSINGIVMFLLMAAGGGAYYYQKVYKSKKEQEIDAMEASDMEQFSADETSDDFDFDYGDDDKDQYLADLIRDDEEEYAAAAERDAEDAGWNNYEAEDEQENIPIMTDADVTGAEEETDIFNDADVYASEYDPEIDGE